MISGQGIERNEREKKKETVVKEANQDQQNL